MSIKRSKLDKMKRWLALFLAALMVLSAAGTLIYYLSMGIYAAEPVETVETAVFAKADDTAKTAVSSVREDDSRKIRVGLMYGTNVTVGFEVDTERGFGIVSVDRSSDKLDEVRLWELEIAKLSCTVDSNLAKTAMTYSITTAADKAVIGGYHLEIGNNLDRASCEVMMTALQGALEPLGLYAIPCFIDGGYRIRAGHFASAESALEASSAIIEALPELEIGIASPTDTAVSLVDPLTDRILFEYDDGDETALGLVPLENPDGTQNYLITPAKKLYDGTFMFRQSRDKDSDGKEVVGVSLTNLIKLGDYIKGVLPYEVSRSWPLETLKAFAITVRSFTLSGIGRHSAYEVDMCNTAHCQIYNGRVLINDVVEQAVDETDGLVMTYKDEIVTAFYSAVQGGVTVSSEDAWGGSIPYLQAVETPWEVYTNHSMGVWTVEVSPSELGAYLRSKGYTEIKGSVASVKIDQLAKNSTYVYKLTITDNYGGKLTLTKTDTVRSALSKYLKSANFVVGKGSVEADVTTFSSESLTDTNIITGSGTFPVKNDAGQSVISASGKAPLTALRGAEVVTKDGVGTPGKLVSHTERQIIKASNPSNFIFVGKGWGHGVGISQIGLRDLAKQGYTAEEMLKKYLTGIEIESYKRILNG